jgi:hypothetical protein
MCENTGRNSAETLSGIDLLITRGPTLDAVVVAIERAAGIARAAIHLAHDPRETNLTSLDHPAWAVVHEYAAGDFAFKVDLDGKVPRNYRAVARNIARCLRVPVAWPDERTLAATAFILCAADGSECETAIDDVSPDSIEGFAIMQNR